MKNNAKKFPLPTGEQWSRLPERVIALESTPKPKVFKATLFQSGESIPEVTSTVENTTGSTFTFDYLGAGAYLIESDMPLFTDRTKTIITLSSGKYPIMTSYSIEEEDRIVLYTFDREGTQINDLLLGNLITIEILD